MSISPSRPFRPLLFALALSWISFGFPPIADAQVWEVGQQLLVGTTEGIRSGEVLAVANLNGDDYEDLIIGQPRVDSVSPNGPRTDTGRVWFHLGGPDGLGPGGGVTFDTTNAAGAFEGMAVAAGDFDGDGLDEIAVGAPGFTVDGQAGAGRVFIARYNPFSGFLNSVRPLTQGTSGVGGIVEADDAFGSALAVGDFDDDGYEDLAVGAPDEDQQISPTRVRRDTGAVILVFGGPDFDTGTLRSQVLFEDSGFSTVGFGEVLAAGDFDDDGHDDLAVGSPYRDQADASGFIREAGEVRVYPGIPGGVDTGAVLVVNRQTLGQIAVENEHFGAALAAADFQFGLFCIFGGCYEDLVIGVPGAPVNGNAAAGEALVFYGAAGGLDTGGFDTLRQNTTGFITSPEAFDLFGSSLAVGNLDSRFGVDLAVGAPGENWTAAASTKADQGTVHLFFGGSSGVNSYPGQGLVQTAGYESFPGDSNHRFGDALAVGRFDGGVVGALAVGVPGWDTFGNNDPGAVQVLPVALYADGFESGGFGNWSVSTP